jgi:hypothetical protein
MDRSKVAGKQAKITGKQSVKRTTVSPRSKSVESPVLRPGTSGVQTTPRPPVVNTTTDTPGDRSDGGNIDGPPRPPMDNKTTTNESNDQFSAGSVLKSPVLSTGTLQFDMNTNANLGQDPDREEMLLSPSNSTLDLMMSEMANDHYVPQFLNPILPVQRSSTVLDSSSKHMLLNAVSEVLSETTNDQWTLPRSFLSDDYGTNN